jgi:NitT/TauT family transport system permease protein
MTKATAIGGPIPVTDPSIESAGERSAGRLRARLTDVALVTASIPVFVAAWFAIVKYFHVPQYLIPYPADVLTALRGGLGSAPGNWWPHIQITSYETLVGFGIGAAAGFVIGAILGLSRLLARILLPYIVAFQAIPKIAIAPLVLIWLGFGATSKIAIVAMIVFFPVMVNTERGLQLTDSSQFDLMRAVGASRWQTLRWVRLPAALPTVFAGLEVGSLFALLAAIVGEFVGSQKGIGILLLQYGDRQDSAATFGLFIVLAAMGILLHQVVRQIGRRLIFWAPDQEAAKATS